MSFHSMVLGGITPLGVRNASAARPGSAPDQPGVDIQRPWESQEIQTAYEVLCGPAPPSGGVRGASYDARRTLRDAFGRQFQAA